MVDRSFDELRTDLVQADETVRLNRSARAGWEVVAPDGSVQTWADPEHAALDFMEQLVRAIVRGLHRTGQYGIHAAALARRGRAVILAGDGGAGKTTIALALAARGLELLSDEMAILDPATSTIHPYPRRVHVRPGTPELIDGLARVARRRRQPLGGGIAWALPREAVGTAGREGRELGAVLLIEERAPVGTRPRVRMLGAGVGVVRLLRGTWAASVDFEGALSMLAPVLGRVPIASVTPADPMATADVIIEWLDAQLVPA
jgi:hypothetical protein